MINRSSSAVAITGVCGGIGKALTAGFIKKNYRVIGIDVNQDGLEQLRHEHPEHLALYQADLLKRELRLDVANQILQEQGVPDIWINNAGIAHIESFADTSVEDFDRVMELNLNAYIDFTRFWLKEMKAVGKGKLVNIASCAGHMPLPQLSSYSASKYGVVGLSETLQEELKMERSPVKLILVSPGFVHTDIVQLGQEQGFPPALSFMLEKPEACAREIIQGILWGLPFIAPTFNGKVLLGMNRLLPELAKLSSHLIVNPRMKKLLGLER